MVYKKRPSWMVAKWLERGQVDVAFTFAPEIQNRDDLDYVVVEQMQEMLVVSSDHPKATPRRQLPGFPGGTGFYTPSPENESNQLKLRLEAMGFPTDKLVPTENLLSSCAAVEQMQGVNFLLEHCSMLNSKTFRAYPDCHVVTLVLAYRKDNRKRAVRQLVKEAARRLKKKRDIGLEIKAVHPKAHRLSAGDLDPERQKSRRFPLLRGTPASLLRGNVP